MLKNILVIEPATSGLEVLKNAYEMDLNVFVFSANCDERIIPEKYKKYIKQLIVVDTNCFNSLCGALLELHSKHILSAIIPGFENFVADTARLAKLINLPGLSLKTCECFRNKYKLRNVLKKANVETLQHYLISSESDLAEIGSYISYPCVIKPIDQSGSVHVSKIESKKELENAYNKMRNDTWSEMGKGVGSKAIVEEYLSGKEYSVEGFVDHNGLTIVSVTEKLVKANPFFVEMGHIVFAPLTIYQNNVIKEHLEHILNILQMKAGVIHAEIKLENDQPKLIEIAGRLGGDKICDLIQLASGINLYQIMIDVHLGKSIKLNINRNIYAGIRYFSPPANMHIYTKLNNIEKIYKIPGFEDFKVLIYPGQVVPPLKNFTGRVAYTIFTAPTYKELICRLDEAERNIYFS